VLLPVTAEVVFAIPLVVHHPAVRRLRDLLVDRVAAPVQQHMPTLDDGLAECRDEAAKGLSVDHTPKRAADEDSHRSILHFAIEVRRRWAHAVLVHDTICARGHSAGSGT